MEMSRQHVEVSGSKIIGSSLTWNIQQKAVQSIFKQTLSLLK